MCSHDHQRTQPRDGTSFTLTPVEAKEITGPRTRVTWWIRDGPCTREGTDLVPGQLSKERAEQLLDAATASVDRDIHTLPRFSSQFYGCEDPTDWGIKEVEEVAENGGKWRKMAKGTN